MADLAAVALGTHEQPAVDDDAATHTHLPREVDDVGRPDRAPPLALGDGTEVGVVADHDRDRQAERVGDQVAEGDVDPAEVGGEPYEPVRLAHEARDSDAHADEHRALRSCRQHLVADVHGLTHDAVGALLALAEGVLTTVQDVAPEADEGHDRPVDPQVDGEDVRALAHRLDAVRRPPDPAPHRLGLADEAGRHEIGDEAADRAAVEAGVADELGAGGRPVVVQEPGERGQVVAAHLVLRGSCERHGSDLPSELGSVVVRLVGRATRDRWPAPDDATGRRRSQR